METLLAKLLISLNLLSIALSASLPPNSIVLNPPSDVFSVSQLIERYFPAEQIETAKRIAWAESRNIPTAKNPSSTATGIFQILKSTAKHFNCGGDLMNPDVNIQCAAKIAENGWGAWKSSGDWH